MKRTKNDDSANIMQLLTSAWITQPLYVVTKLGIPDILAEESKSLEELADKTNSYAPFLYRIMRALSSAGFFYENEDHVFTVSSMGELLQKDKMQPVVLMFLSEWHNNAWNKLLQSVQTGKIAFDIAFGKNSFEWLMEYREEADIFNKANHIKAVSSHTEITEVYDFSKIKTVADIGGGYGGLLFHILNMNSHISGIVADLTYIQKTVQNEILKNELGDRCSFMECDFFEKVPAGSDCYILSNILHDWDDNRCQAIISNCCDAMHSESKLLIVESLIPAGNEFSIVKLLDLEVLVMGGGKERTELEFRDLLNNTDLILNRIIPTKENISILECSRDIFSI